MSLESLMPTINPNLDELAKDNTPLQPPKKKATPDEIFASVQATNKKHREAKGKKVEESPENTIEKPADLRVAESPEVKLEIADIVAKPQRGAKKKYPHLEKARAVASANRKKKSEEKRLIKEQQKIEKAELKAERAEIRKEKNRVRALENYHKKKDLKQDNLSTIMEDMPTPSKPNGMDYDRFASYMEKWEKGKSAKVEKIPTKPIAVRKPQYIPRPVSPPRRPEQPTNYLSFYQKKKSVNDLFKL